MENDLNESEQKTLVTFSIRSHFTASINRELQLKPNQSQNQNQDQNQMQSIYFIMQFNIERRKKQTNRKPLCKETIILNDSTRCSCL